MKESRLFKIVYYILENGRTTAPKLAEKFEVSVRTIYRDIDAISSAGIPIYVTTGRNGDVQILEDYVLDGCLFTGTIICISTVFGYRVLSRATGMPNL